MKIFLCELLDFQVSQVGGSFATGGLYKTDKNRDTISLSCAPLLGTGCQGIGHVIELSLAYSPITINNCDLVRNLFSFLLRNLTKG